MESGQGIHQNTGYVVTTPLFEGPLDLLLYLIERAELDITRLALAQVTEQYLEHLHHIEDQQAAEVSSFLVVAARLLQIKSEVLLPRPPVRDAGEDDPGEALVRQLIIYKRFKELANKLLNRESARQRTYLRLSPPLKPDAHFDLGDLSLADLLAVAQNTFIKIDERSPLAEVVAAPKITIREKIHQINISLRQHSRIYFAQLLPPRPTILEIIVTFLAMLELIKRQLVVIRQEELFGEILIENSGISDDTEEFELEFGE